MAFLNLSRVDLKKLKIFIIFVLENPTVLNKPQLQFLKDLIEKLGGKVPDGDYKMPTDAVDVGDAQENSVNTGITSSMKVDASESELESEVDSVTEAQTQQDAQEDLSEPHLGTLDDASAVYLKDPKCYRRSRKKLKQKKVHHSYGSPTKKEKNDVDDDSDEQLECNVECIIENSDMSDTPEEDPINILSLHMPNIKTEPNTTNNDDVQDDSAAGGNECDKDNTTDSDSDDDEPIIIRRRRTRMRITRQAAKRGRKKIRATSTYHESKRVKKPKAIGCGLSCKYSCSEKIDATQRNELCKQFWALSLVERKRFLLTCFERKPLGPMRMVKAVKRRNFTKDYFLCTADGERARVCMRFFHSTLNISNYLVSEAITHSDAAGKPIVEAEDQAKVETGKDAIEASEGVSNAEAEAQTGKEMEAETKLGGAVESAVESGDRTGSTAVADNKANALNGTKTTPSKQLPLPATPAATGVAAAAKQKSAKSSSSDKDKKAKRVRAPQVVKCAELCKWKCHTLFNEEQRTQICTAFWDMSYKRRKDFVLSRIESHDISRMTAEEYRKTKRAQRTFTNRYFFRDARGNVRVCAHFFMATLCITRHFIQNAQRNIDKITGTYAGEDKRGRVPRPNKIDDEMQNIIRRHIESYPTWMPHKNYKRRFLHSSLSKSKMYADYKQQCEKEQRKSVCFNFFAKIFDRDFQLSFLKPTSKHAHKVSPQKKTTVTSTVASIQPDEPARKDNNPNISEFTGEEGGFWINPDGSRSASVVQPQYPQQAPATSTSTIQYAQPAALASYAMQYGYEHHPVFQAPSYGEQNPNLQLL